MGNVRAVTQPTGTGQHTTVTYTYTPLNEVQTETDPADPTHAISYDYDFEGRQKDRFDLHSGVTETTQNTAYDADGRPVTTTATSTTGAPAFQSVRAYDPTSNILGVTTTLGGAPVSTIANLFANSGQVTSTVETLTPPGGTAVSKATTYAYRNDGSLAARTFDGVTTNYTYRLNNEEATTAPPTGSPFTSTYFPNGALKTETLPNGASLAEAYDAASRLASKAVTKGSATLASWTATGYDADSRVTATTITQVIPHLVGSTLQTGVATFGYDTSSRLTSFKGSQDSSTTTYGVDDAGNVTGDGTSSFSYTANRLTSMVTGANTTTYGYDHLGNQVTETSSSGVTTTSYDAANHPRAVNQALNTITYAYDGLGRLAVRQEGLTTQLFFHNGTADTVAQETDLLSGITASTTRYVLDSGGNQLAKVDQAGIVTTTSYLVTSPRGDVVEVLDSGGNVVNAFGYDPFGNARSMQTDQSLGAPGSKLRFQGAPKDTTTGEYTLGPRLYNPQIDRFVGADLYAASGASLATQLDPLTGNRYLYAGANPAGLIDDGYKGVSDFLTGKGGCIFGYTNGPGSACRGSREVKDTINAVTETSPSQLVHEVGNGARTSFVDAPVAMAKQVARVASRGPDYVNVNLNVPSGNTFALTIDRYGRVYVGAGRTGGASDIIPSISGGLGYLNQTKTPTKDELEQFIGGLTVTCSGGFYGYLGQTYSPLQGQTATEVGGSTPGVQCTGGVAKGLAQLPM